MISKTTRSFRDALARLPAEIQRQARESYRLFQRDPNHPSLRFKRVHSSDPIYSARINIDYRVVGVRDGEEFVWFWVGPHAEYEKLLRKF